MDDLLNTLKVIKFVFINGSYRLFKNKLIIDKTDKYKNSTIKFFPSFINANRVDDIVSLTDCIKKFLNTMSKCKNFNSTIFIKNFEKTMFDIKDLNDEYFGTTNIFKIDSLYAIYHELLHLASTVENAPEYSVFEEGYTQLLEERYFNKLKKYRGSIYPFEVEIMKNIELILGRDYLETMFFNGELKDAVNSLSKYTSLENIDKLIQNMNIIYDIENNDLIIKKRKEFQIALNNIFGILFDSLKEKLNDIPNFQDRVNLILQGSWNKYLRVKNGDFYIDFNFMDDDITKEFTKLGYSRYLHK